MAVRFPRRKRPGYKRCASMVLGDATKALAVANSVKRLLNVEFKNHDVTLTSVGIPDGVGLITQLTNIPQGDTGISRDGANLKLTSIYMKLLLRISASATNSNIRVMIVCDKQTNQAIYTTADLLLSAANVVSVVSPLNLDNQFRFKILYDKNFSVFDSGSKTALSKVYKKLNLKLRFDASTPSIADLRSSSLSLVLISSEPTNEPTVSGVIRLRFVDN